MAASTISTLGIVVKSSGTISEYFALSVTADGGWTPVLVDSAAPTYNKFPKCKDTSRRHSRRMRRSIAVNDLMTTYRARHVIDLVQPGRTDDPGRLAELVAAAENAGIDGLEWASAC